MFFFRWCAHRLSACATLQLHSFVGIVQFTVIRIWVVIVPLVRVLDARYMCCVLCVFGIILRLFVQHTALTAQVMDDQNTQSPHHNFPFAHFAPRRLAQSKHAIPSPQF